MLASEVDMFYTGMLLAIICFCVGLFRIMNEASTHRTAERETLIGAKPSKNLRENAGKEK